MFRGHNVSYDLEVHGETDTPVFGVLCSLGGSDRKGERKKK